MASNLHIDPALLEEALAIGGMSTKRETVNQALREFILRREQKKIKDLFGTVLYEESYDYKKNRGQS